MSTSSHSLDALAATAALPVHPRDPSVPAEVYAEVARLGLGERFPRVVQLTRELFGENFQISVEQDPELADWFHVVFTVRVAGSAEEILAKNTQWHRRLPRETAEAGGAFCLSIDDQP